jgi:hypothetical protein
MAEKNVTAAIRARWAREEKRGRPLGSTELLPRRRTGDKRRGTTPLTIEDQLTIAREELGNAYRRIEDLESQLGVGRFDGDTKAFLTAVMRGEYLASPQQIYSARALLPIEYPPATTVDGRPIEAIKDEIRREREAEADDCREQLLDQVNRIRAAKDAVTARKWGAIVERGILTVEQAAEVRRILEDDDYWREAPITEILEPSAQVAIRKRSPPEIDTEPVQHDCDMAENVETDKLVNTGLADMKSASQTPPPPELQHSSSVDPAPASQPSSLISNPGLQQPAEPVQDMIEVAVPSRGPNGIRWITKHVPRPK